MCWLTDTIIQHCQLGRTDDCAVRFTETALE